MRIKTTITIDEGVLRAIDSTTSRGSSRSRVIEDAAREFLARRAQTAREAGDVKILNASADALRREMEDVLPFRPTFEASRGIHALRRARRVALGLV